MRPVNLIPQDQRRGERSASRTGALPYVLLGALALVLVGVIALVRTGAQIEERKGEAVALEQREQVARTKAEALAPYVAFASLAATREQTVDQLANSRFDWERVLNELALVLPADVWLTELTGTVSPGVQVQGAAGVASRDEILGPALELVGCAASQEGVANLISTLRDIDGVTRVGLDSSTRSDAGGAGESGGGGSEGDCRTRDFITQFQIVVAFDAAPAAAGSATESEAPPAPPADPAASGTSGDGAPPAEGGAQASASAPAATSAVPAGVAR